MPLLMAARVTSHSRPSALTPACPHFAAATKAPLAHDPRRAIVQSCHWCTRYGKPARTLAATAISTLTRRPPISRTHTSCHTVPQPSHTCRYLTSSCKCTTRRMHTSMPTPLARHGSETRTAAWHATALAPCRHATTCRRRRRLLTAPPAETVPVHGEARCRGAETGAAGRAAAAAGRRGAWLAAAAGSTAGVLVPEHHLLHLQRGQASAKQCAVRPPFALPIKR